MSVDVKRPVNKELSAPGDIKTVSEWVGKKIVHVKTGRVCLVGVQSGRSGFWVMDLEKSQKSVVGASQIMTAFRLVDEDQMLHLG